MTKKIKTMVHPPHYRFKGWMAENNVRLQEIADLLGITKTSVSRKNNGYQNYTFTEVDKICQHYNMSPEIFLYQKVS
jgi:transcriptional regulator with XRE-family HTH domain